MRRDFKEILKRGVICMVVVLLAPGPAQGQSEIVAFENVDAEYRSLADVHPVVTNRGRQTIYLWPQDCREALVSWLQRDEVWYDSDREPCPRTTKAIVLKQGQTYGLPPLVIRFDF